MQKHKEICKLRLRGKSILEIVKETGVPKSTVRRHVLGIVVPQKYLQKLKEKQGGSKERAAGLRANVLMDAENFVKDLSEREYFMLLTGLYWGEGTKKDFSVINSDSKLIQTIIVCLKKFKISQNRLSIALRVHDTISIPNAKEFWSKTTGLPQNNMGSIEVISAGKKRGKLPYGMCRLRVKSGIRERLMIQSVIDLIGKQAHKEVVSM